MNELPKFTAYASALVDYVREAIELEPERFGGCRSWEDLHDVCDANDFLQEADAYLGVEWHSYDPVIAELHSDAIALAEETLWPSL